MTTSDTSELRFMVESEMDTLTKARILGMRKPTAIIPNVTLTAGNQRLVNDLWLHLRSAVIKGNDLIKVTQMFIKMHGSKADEIRWTLRHFVHTMGINYAYGSDEFWHEQEIVMEEYLGVNAGKFTIQPPQI